MLYTVEVRMIGGDLPTFMSEMRTWLDHHRLEPDAFRYSPGSPTTTFRVDFKLDEEAKAFAKAFGGRVLGTPQEGGFAPSVPEPVVEAARRAHSRPATPPRLSAAARLSRAS